MKLSDLIGNTPLIELESGVSRPGVRLFGKLEGQNPGGSVKDRPAYSMILRAEERGELKRGMRLIEPTSGNTGIALAMIAAARGYPIELVMPEGSTEERVALMRAYGATVTLTPKAAGMEGAIDYAHEAVRKGGALMLDQFANPDNPRAHYETTGPELWRETREELTHFVSAMGTTGTIMGVSRYLREVSRGRAAGPVQIIGCQPTDGSQIPGIRRWPEAYLPKIYDRTLVDQLLDIRQSDAEQTARALIREQGLFVGISAAGAVWAARKICAELSEAGRDGVVACILCDRGDRYLSSAVFDPEAP